MIAYDRLPNGWVAHAEVTVGTLRRVFDIALGPMPEPDPGGLRSVPVVMVPFALAPLVEAGGRRAGGRPATAMVQGDADRPIGGRLLAAAMDGAELIVVIGGEASAIEAARALAGRPLPVLTLDDPEAALVLIRRLAVDVNVAIPGVEARREEIRAIVARLELERVHHPVEVDPRPAFDELGLASGDASLDELAAGAAGVLAGRIAGANRRWRP